jgi:hypothetical protein
MLAGHVEGFQVGATGKKSIFLARDPWGRGGGAAGFLSDPALIIQVLCALVSGTSPSCRAGDDGGHPCRCILWWLGDPLAAQRNEQFNPQAADLTGTA